MSLVYYERSIDNTVNILFRNTVKGKYKEENNNLMMIIKAAYRLRLYHQARETTPTYV